jgi:hypothetical protein
VLGVGIVVVDGLFDEPQAEQVGVEVNGPVHITADGCDVVYALNFQFCPLPFPNYGSKPCLLLNDPLRTRMPRPVLQDNLREGWIQA